MTWQKDIPGDRRSSEGGQGRRGTKPVRQFLIPTHSRSCLDNLSSSSSSQQSSGQSHFPQHCSTNRECSQCPAPADAAASQPFRTTSHQGKGSTASCAKRTPTAPQPGKSTVHPHVSAHDQLRTWVYQTQYYVSSSGHTHKSTNEQHRAAYHTFAWLHSPRLQVFLVQEISWTWCGLSP